MIHNSVFFAVCISVLIENQITEESIWTIDASFRYGAFYYFIPYQETWADETDHGFKLWAGIYKE